LARPLRLFSGDIDDRRNKGQEQRGSHPHIQAIRLTPHSRPDTTKEPTAMGSRKERMKIREENGVTILDLGQVEIWDGADLALLRDTFARKCGRNGCKSLGVDMSSVKYVPSGFFGMLFDWHEMGVAIRLYTPQPRVANMLWFRQFFDEESKGAYRLLSEPKELLAFDDSCDWNDEEEEVWVEEPRPKVGALGNR